LKIARQEIFRLKEENFQLKKDQKGKVSSNSTFLTSSTKIVQNGESMEESKVESNDVI